MSTEVAVEWREGFGPVVTYTVVGGHDVMRWCYHMLHGQVEFGRDARGILQKLRRRWGAKEFDALDKTLTGNRMRAASIRPRGGV